MNEEKTIELPVEFVENIQEKLGWIVSTISFWHLEKVWPCNLIRDVCDNIYDELQLDDLKDLKFVSVSHIIDK